MICCGQWGVNATGYFGGQNMSNLADVQRLGLGVQPLGIKCVRSITIFDTEMTVTLKLLADSISADFRLRKPLLAVGRVRKTYLGRAVRTVVAVAVVSPL